VRAAEPRRSMSSDEGGVSWVSRSSRVRRARSSRGTFPGTRPEVELFGVAFFAAFGAGRPAGFLAAIAFEGAFLLAFFAGAFFLADACRFAGRFFVGRLAEPLAADLFFAALAGFPRLAAFRLAINPVLSEP